MGWSDDSKVAAVKGGYLGGTGAFGGGDDAGVNATEGEVGVLGDQLAHAGQVLREDCGHRAVAALRQVVEVGGFDGGAAVVADQVAGLRRSLGRGLRVADGLPE